MKLWKKRKYNENILRGEDGSFTPLVFTINGGMGKETIKVLSDHQKISCIVSENVTDSKENVFFDDEISLYLYLWKSTS